MNLRDYPAEIEMQANVVFRLTESRDDARQALEQTVDNITAAVLIAVDPETHKPRYTNDKAREIEIRQRQRESAEWQLWNSNLDEAEAQMKAGQARLERLRGEFAAQKLERAERIAEAMSSSIIR